MRRIDKHALGKAVVGVLFILLALFVFGGLQGCSDVPDVIPTPTPIVAVTATPLPSTPVPTLPLLTTLNKVRNPSFTEGQYTYPADGVLVNNVPAEYVPYTLNGVYPDYYWQLDKRHVYDGWASYSFAVKGRALQGGLYQVLYDLQPGALYHAHCMGFAYAGRDAAGYPSEGMVVMQVGIDPQGGTTPLASSVIWSYPQVNMLGSVANLEFDAYLPGDVFHSMEVHFTAVQERNTLFIQAVSQQAYDRSEVTVDLCRVHAAGWAFEFYGMP